MKNRQLGFLVLAGAILALLAWWTSRDQQAASTPRTGGPLLPSLDVNQVNEIVITSGSESARIIRTESGWQLPDRYYYPADFDSIRRFLLTLDSLKTGQTIITGDKQREEMQLAGPESIRVTIKTQDQKTTQFTVGAFRQPPGEESSANRFQAMSGGRFIAVEGNDYVSVVDDMLHQASAEVTRWMDTTLLDVPSSSITSVGVNPAEAEPFRVIKNEEGLWNFDPPLAKGVFDGAKNRRLTGILSFLTMENVADPVLTDEALGFGEKETLLNVQTHDGTRYTLRIGESGDDGAVHIRIAISHEAPPLSADTSAEESAEQLADEILSADAARTAAEGLHQRLSPWTYRLDGAKADSLRIQLDELILTEDDPDDDDGQIVPDGNPN